MKPVTYDFDVITDTPRIQESPKRRLPEPAEKAPQPASHRQQSAAPPEQDERDKVRAAE